jgi:hypothetical protein
MQQRPNGGLRRQLGQSRYRAVLHAVPSVAERVWHGLRFGELYRSSKEFDLMGRAMGFAALAMLTLIPLLIVIAAAALRRIRAWPCGSSTAWA